MAAVASRRSRWISAVPARVKRMRLATRWWGWSPTAVRLGRALGLSSDEAADAVQGAVGLAWRPRDQLRGAIQPRFLAIVRRWAGRVRRWLTIPAFWSSTSRTG